MRGEEDGSRREGKMRRRQEKRGQEESRNRGKGRSEDQRGAGDEEKREVGGERRGATNVFKHRQYTQENTVIVSYSRPTGPKRHPTERQTALAVTFQVENPDTQQ